MAACGLGSCPVGSSGRGSGSSRGGGSRRPARQLQRCCHQRPHAHPVLSPCGCQRARAGGSVAAAVPRGAVRPAAAAPYRELNDDLADRRREVWDDEEDVTAAAAQLGWDRDALPADSGPLLSAVNRLYTEAGDAPEAFLSQLLELRYVPGSGYSLFARKAISQGQLLAVCPPLAWVSGPAGQPPPLDALVRHLGRQRFSRVQRRVLASLASLPALDEAHSAKRAKRAAAEAADPLLSATRRDARAALPGAPGAWQDDAAAAHEPPGVTASSVSLSRSAELKRRQRQLRAASDRIDWDAEDGEEDEDEGEQRDDDGSDSDSDDEEDNPWLVQQQQMRALGISTSAGWAQQLGISAAAGAGRRGGPDAGLAMQRAALYGHKRRSPDVLQFVRCTARPAEGAAAPRGDLLGFTPERLSALVCRNALLELSQDLTTATARGEKPASLAGVWPLLALFNHSCAPNAAVATLGRQPEQTAQQKLIAARQQQRQVRGSVGGGGPLARRGRSTGGSGGRAGGSGQLAQDAGAGGGLAFSAEAGSGPFVLVRAAAELEAGDEVCIDYLAAGIEGGLVHQERRRAALAQRWGFTCMCERCLAEQQLGAPVARLLGSANTVAARLGPRVAAALAARDRETLGDAVKVLWGLVQALEELVDTPNTPARVGAWAHASMYQVHALLAVARVALDPINIKSVAAIGTAAELAGITSAGGAVQVLAMASLVSASADAWGGEDDRVEGALRALLQVLQLRYGPLEAGVSTLLAKASQHWAHQIERVPLGLLSPAAAAAVQARKLLVRSAAKQSAAAAGGAGQAAEQAGSAAAAGAAEEDEEEDRMAAELALEADEVLEVSDELVDSVLYSDAAAGAAGEAAEQPGSEPQPPDTAGQPQPHLLRQQQGDDYVLVRQRSEAEVRAELDELYSGLRYAALSPDERAQLAAKQWLLRQQQAQQQQQEHDAAGADPWRQGQQQQAQAQPEQPGDVDQALPLMTAWLQGRLATSDADLASPGQPRQPRQPQQPRPRQPGTPQVQQQPQPQPRPRQPGSPQVQRQPQPPRVQPQPRKQQAAFVFKTGGRLPAPPSTRQQGGRTAPPRQGGAPSQHGE